MNHPLKVACFANNFVGLESVKHIRNSGCRIEWLILNQDGRRKFADEIVEASGLADDQVLSANQLADADVLKRIAESQVDCGVSAFFAHILRGPVIGLFPRGIVNLHTSLLPLNRGSYPNVWTIVEETSAGTTMHLVDKGVDTGPILAQSEIEVEPADTGKSLNEKLERNLVELFKANWGKFVRGELNAVPQDDTKATCHRVKDVESIDRIELEQQYSARELINVLRARSFPPHRGAYFEVDGKRYFLRLEIEQDGEDVQ